MLVHTGVGALLAVGVGRIGGHSEDRQVGVGEALAQRAGGGQPVHLRHLHVHQHQVVGAAGGHCHCLATVVGDLHHQPLVGQQLAGDLLVERVVLGQQNTRATHRRKVRGAGSGCAAGGWRGPCVVQTQHAEDGLEQQRGVHRLGQDVLQPDAGRLFDQPLAGIGGEHHHVRPQAGRQLLHRPRQIEPAHALRHLPVDHREVERLTSGGCVPQQAKGGFARGGGGHLQRHAGEHLLGDAQCGLVVVHHQHPSAGEVVAQQHAP